MINSSKNLPAVVWPVDALAPHFAAARACAYMSRGACGCWHREGAAADTFAAANGWVVHRGRLPRRFAGLDFLHDVIPLVDHPVLFRKPGSRKVVAVLSHDYHPARDFSALSGAVAVDRLPRSWYARGGPDRTTAYLLRPVTAPVPLGHSLTQGSRSAFPAAAPPAAWRGSESRSILIL